MNRRFFAEFLTVLSLYEQEGKAGTSDKADAPGNDPKTSNGDLTVPLMEKDRRPSQLISVPSCISLHSEILDLTYDAKETKDKKT